MNSGYVTLVGAGCGKDLITVKGLRAVKNADVIVYDDLIDFNLLCEARADAEKIYVGKRFGSHSEEQDKINSILINCAKSSKNVVRLKGGDSFVFGRGGEELIALKAENIPCEVIPGVSSAIAVPEISGIPVTHRGASQSFTVVTGHTATHTDENYKALAKLNGTLVFLMGLNNIEKICTRLIENGKSPDTPVSVISKGFTNEQKRTDGVLKDICKKAKNAEAPAVIVVGSTAELDLSKTVSRPLENISVTVTGTVGFAKKLALALTELGAYAEICESIAIKPIENSIPDDFSEYKWLLFTSANGVNIFFEHLLKQKVDIRRLMDLKFACIGNGSAGALEKYGIYPDFIPSEFTAKALGKELSGIIPENERCLILRAKDGSEDLTRELEKSKTAFDDVKIYTAEAIPALRKEIKTDYITFASASGVSAFFEQNVSMGKAVPVCIGNMTAKEFIKRGGFVPLTAKTHTAEGIISVITEDINEKIQTASSK